jgi:molecular chaperone GrpE
MGKDNKKEDKTKKNSDIKNPEDRSKRELIDENEKLREEIRKLALTIDEVEDEKQEKENQLKKALADYQNLEKGIDSRVNSRIFQERKKIAQDLMEIFDDIKFGVQASQKLELGEDAQAWLEGVVGTMNKIERALDKIGVSVIEVEKGDKFDTDTHEAIAVVDEGDKNTIHEVIQQGYELDGSVIRAAKVVVNKKS